MVPILVDGITFGLQLALLAVGLTLIFGLGEVLNLSHGEFAVIAGISAALIIEAGAHPIVGSVLAVLLTGLLGLAVDRSLMLPVYRSRGETRILMGLFITLGLSFAIHGFITNRFALVQFSLTVPLETLYVAGLAFRPSSLLAGAISAAVLVLLILFLTRTVNGKAIRSIVQNETGAQICGINPARMRTLIFTMGAMLAGLAGIMRGLSAALGPEAGVELTTFALIVAIVGGVRSVKGAMVAGLTLGVVNAVVSFLVGTYVASIIFLLAAITTILVRPEGVLGLRA